MTMVVPARLIHPLSPASAGSCAPLQLAPGRDAILARYRDSVDWWIGSAFRAAAITAYTAGHALEEDAVGIPIRHHLARRRFTIRSRTTIMGQQAPVRAILHLTLDGGGIWSSDASATQQGSCRQAPIGIEHLREVDVQRAFKALLHLIRH